MNIPKLIKEAHENAIERGFYDCPQCENGNHVDDTDSENVILTKCNHCNGTGIDPNKNIGELLMLIVSELGEALEAHRCGRFANWDKYENYYTNISKQLNKNYSMESFEQFIKDTFEDEIADVFIRLFDLCGYLGIEPEIKETPRIVPENIAEALLDMVSFCIVIHGIYKMPPINPDRVTEIKMAWLFSDIIKFCDSHNIPIEKHIKAKMAYNRTPPHKHGKEY